MQSRRTIAFHLTWMTCALLLAPALLRAADTGNMVANPSFEIDWINAKAQRGLISRWEEYGYNQSDLKPDSWSYTVDDDPGARLIVLDSTVAHSGKHSLRIDGGKPAARGAHRFALQSHPLAKYMGNLGQSVFNTGTAGQGQGATAVHALEISAADAPKFFRDVTLSAWVKARDVPQNSSIRVSYELGGIKGPTMHAEFPAGTYEWQQLAVKIPAAELVAVFQKSIPAGRQVALLPRDWTLRVSYSPDPEQGGGTVWFDDVSVVEELPQVANLAPNSGFEEAGQGQIPRNWSKQWKFNFIPPQWYYVWRNWAHFFSEPRGQIAADDLIAHSGRRSFRFSVLPGDEKYSQSDPIAVNQDAARPIEIGAWVRADRIRFLDLRAVDEQGEYLNDWSFITATADPETGMEYRGTFDWRYIRKFVASDKPLKTIRVRLCARGFNGLNMDDVGRKHSNNNVGTLWWDDVRVMDVLAPARSAPTAPAVAADIQVVNIDFGARLYGDNRVTVTLRSAGSAAAAIEGQLNVKAPANSATDARQRLASSARVQIAPGAQATLTLPYTIWTVCEDWRQQYHVDLALSKDGRALGTTALDFGGWPLMGRVEVERSYPYPRELKQQMVWVNFGVSPATLGQVQSLRYDFIRRASGKVSHSLSEPQFQKTLADFRKSQPVMDWKVDEFQLWMRNIDMSFLPLHDDVGPVRDHVLRIVALGAGGRELFRCESPPLGAMREHSEQLEPIRTVEVKDGRMEVNGKPFFMRACLGHSWGLEPAPSQRKPWTQQKKVATGEKNSSGQPLMKTVFDYSRVKQHGFNAFWPNVEYNLKDWGDQIWSQNLYSGCWYPQPYGANMLGFNSPHGTQWQTSTTRDEYQAVGRHPGTLMISFTAWEGGMSEDLYLDPAKLDAHARFARQVKQLARRPLFSSGGYSAVKQQYGWMYDVFGPETNWDGPPRVPYTVLHGLRAQGRDVMGMDFPNIFDDMAYDVIRFEIYEGIIRGHRGYAQIGKWPDNSLYRGFNGELRYLEKFIFAPPDQPAISVEPVHPASVPKTSEGRRERYLPKLSTMERKIGGATYLIATNAQPIRHGDWTWTDKLAHSGKRAHSGESIFVRIHPERFLDWHTHGYRDDKPIVFEKGDVVVQQVYVPEGQRAQNVMLMVEGNGTWRHNAVWGKLDFKEFSDSKIRFRLMQETHRWLWNSIGGARNVREVFGQELYTSTFERDFLRQQDFFAIGEAPPTGKWTRLAVPVEKLGLVGKVCTAFQFVSKGAKLWWDYTAVERGGETIVLCDDVLGASEQELAAIRFRGARPGATVNDVFDDRTLTADAKGSFVEDFRGENLYDVIGEGMAGDKAAPTLYYGGGYHYNYPRAVVRVYEIP